jgi:[CysO sulfur-carrier protein]-S-L-cysteine hydrolase
MGAERGVSGPLMATASDRAGAHPGPPAVRLPRAIADAIIVQARAELPNEACGIVTGSAYAADGGAPLAYEACRNRAGSPYRYEIHPDDLYRVIVGGDDAGLVPWAIVHSHVRSEARPSGTDVGLAFYPDALHVLVSLAEDQAGPDGAPSLRAWRIVERTVHEVALEVIEAPGA